MNFTLKRHETAMPERENTDVITKDDLLRLWQDLRRTARKLLAQEHNAQSLQPTLLVLSALRRLGGKHSWDEITWDNREHFFGSANQAMRRALIDHANSRRRRQGEGTVPLDQLHEKDHLRLWTLNPNDVVELLEREEILDAFLGAVDRLATQHPRKAEVIELRLWCGLKHAEIAEKLRVDERTVKRDWQEARIWIKEEMERRLDKE